MYEDLKALTKKYDWKEIYENSWQHPNIKLIIEERICDKFRHGICYETIIQLKDTEKYYKFYYRVSIDNETHGMRDVEYSLTEVVPTTKVIIDYVPVNVK